MPTKKELEEAKKALGAKESVTAAHIKLIKSLQKPGESFWQAARRYAEESVKAKKSGVPLELKPEQRALTQEKESIKKRDQARTKKLHTIQNQERQLEENERDPLVDAVFGTPGSLEKVPRFEPYQEDLLKHIAMILKNPQEAPDSPLKQLIMGLGQPTPEELEYDEYVKQRERQLDPWVGIEHALSQLGGGIKQGYDMTQPHLQALGNRVGQGLQSTFDYLQPYGSAALQQAQQIPGQLYNTASNVGNRISQLPGQLYNAGGQSLSSLFNALRRK